MDNDILMLSELLIYCKKIKRDALLVLYLMLVNSLFRTGYRPVHVDSYYQFIYVSFL
jgi:hypothetical protein